MILVDVNILLFAVNDSAPEHPAIREWWESALDSDQPVGLPWIALLGFLRLATRAFPEPLTVDDALGRLNAWLSHPNTELVGETDNQWAVMEELVRGVGTAGNLTTDAYLAALAMTHNARLVSCDNDFHRFPGLNWENPLANKR